MGCRRMRWRRPTPPGGILLPDGLCQQPEVEAATVTDDGRGGRAGGDRCGRAVDVVGPAANPLGEAHTAVRVPHLRPQLLFQPLKVAAVRTH